MMKKITTIIFVVLLLMSSPLAVLASTPFQGYTYNYWGTLVPSPAAYAPVRSFGLSDIRCGEMCGLHSGMTCTLEAHINLGDMFEPTDINVDLNKNIYVVDSGNNRIIVFDIELNLNRVIDGFWRDGEWDTFNRPHRVFVADDMQIFVADTQNNRIVIINEDCQLIREILSPPEVEALDPNFIFLPIHVLVDRGGRTFVISQREFQGIMTFNDDGKFIGYFGTISVGVNWVDFFWRILMTEDQDIYRGDWLPREFQSMSMDEYGFVFTSHVENWHLNNQIMRLNPRGEDVLRNFNDPRVIINGDQGWRDTGPLSGPSVLTDVVARSHGRYSALCNTRGRIFTYDSEGNLLYVFSGTGSLEGMTRGAVSIETFGEDILILDRIGRGRIVHFEPTEYGRLINTAIQWRYDGQHGGVIDGEEVSAVDLWRRIAQIDENFSLAWSGIGRAYLARGENATAMYYLERGMDIRYYSVAFRRNRLDVMQDILPTIMTGGMIFIVLMMGINIFRKVKGKGATA